MFKRFILFVVFLGLTVCSKKAFSLDFPGLNVDWSNWDPIGNNILRPIEHAIPGLRLRGFLENESNIQINHRPHAGTNLLDSTFNFSKIEWLLELEGHYSFTPNLELVGISHFLYDSAYDWDHLFKRRFGRNPIHPHQSEDFLSLQYYSQVDRVLKELYLDYRRENLFVRLGKQQVVWGKLDGEKIMDFINPDDFREGIDGADDFEVIRLPLWMANFLYSWKDYNLQFLWIPDFEYSITPEGSPWQFNPRPVPPFFISINRLSRDRPDDFDIEDSELALRFSILKKGWDVKLSYFYTWDDLPTFFSRGSAVSFPGPFGPFGPPFINIFLEPTHTRLHKFGMNFEKAFYITRLDRQIVLRGEGVLTTNKYFEDTFEPDWEDGQQKKDFLFFAPVLETTVFTDWFIGLRFDNKIVINYNDDDGDLRDLAIGKKLEDYAWGLNFSVNKLFYKDRANLLTWVAYSGNDGGGWWFWDLTFQFTDYLIGKIGWSFQWGNRDDFFGQWKEMDNFKIGFKYSF